MSAPNVVPGPETDGEAICACRVRGGLHCLRSVHARVRPSASAVVVARRLFAQTSRSSLR